MRFLIIGAGGIGAYYGARLIDSGQEVLFIARGEHLSCMQSEGLRISHPEFSFHRHVDAMDLQSLVQERAPEQFDLILLTVKAGATQSILSEIAPWLGESMLAVLSLQNGVDNELALEAMIGRECTIGGLAVRIGGHIIQPGLVEATGPAQIVMGCWPNDSTGSELVPLLSKTAGVFNAAEIPTTISPDIQRELWRKLLINNGVNPLSALTRLDTRSLTAHPVYTRSVYRMMEEAAEAGKADGVHLTREDIDEMYQLICQFDAIKTSMLVDREKGRPLELDDIAGSVLRRCEHLGSEAPTTALISALLTHQIAQERASVTG